MHYVYHHDTTCALGLQHYIHVSKKCTGEAHKENAARRTKIKREVNVGNEASAVEQERKNQVPFIFVAVMGAKPKA
jgi:hypothetical protein